jgi:hypothetical protein
MKKLFNVVSLVLMLSMLLTTSVIADNTVPDGDGVTPVAANPLVLGEVCANSTVQDTVLVAISRQGNYGSTNVFKKSSTVTVTVQSVSGAGLSAVVTAPGTIAIPANWDTVANTTMSPYVTSPVTFVAGAVGTLAGSITYRATGVRDNDTTLTRDATVAVTATIVDCGPSDTTPPVISYTVNGVYPPVPDGDNGWYVSDALVEWTVTDPESSFTIDEGCDDTTIDYDTTGVTLSCTATSAGGTAGPVAVTIKRDATDPTISADLDKTPAASGWFNTITGAPTVEFTCSDATSLIATCPADYLFGEGEDQSHGGTAYDNAGNSAYDEVTDVDVDLTAPTAAPTQAPLANAAGWNKTDVTITWNWTDGGAGIDLDNCESTTLVTDEDIYEGDDAISADCYDLAGNKGTKTYELKIDKTDPTISASLDKTPAVTGWYNLDTGAPTVSFTCADALSGLASACPESYLFPEGADQSKSETIFDKAGNSATDGVSGINVDLTAPTAAPTQEPDANDAGWNKTDVTITWNWTDGGAGIDLDPEQCPSTTLVDVEGEYVGDDAITADCFDLAGNKGTKTYELKIDKTNPTIFASLAPTVPASGWYNMVTGYPTVTFTCDDTLSGIDSCTVPYTFTEEGMAKPYSGTAVDKAGNSANASGTVDIDMTPPGIIWSNGPVDGESYYFGFVPAEPTCTATDDLSGPGTCTVTGYGNAAGQSYTLKATAYDVAGNETEETRSYTVLAWTLNGFYRPIDMTIGVWNTVKGGSTIPLKFRIFAGETELTDVKYVKSFTYQYVGANNGGSEDPIETLATGGTILRYDTVEGQFIYNWKTPRVKGDYIVTMTTLDGSSIVAYIRFK